MKHLFLFSFSIILILSCDENTKKKAHYPIPTSFPLKVGNAWIYTRSHYDANGNIERLQEDTLYIYGRVNEYYKYSWNPYKSFNLVKIKDHYFANFAYGIEGQSIDSISYYDDPAVWQFFLADTGFYDITYVEQYDGDMHYYYEEKHELFGDYYDAIISETWKKDESYRKIIHFVELGYEYFEIYNTNKYILSETIVLNKVLKNFYPPGLNKPSKSKHFINKNSTKKANAPFEELLE